MTLCIRTGASIGLLFLLNLAGAWPPAAHAIGLLQVPGVIDVQVSHDGFAAHSEPHVAENPRNPQVLVAGSKFFSDVEHYHFKIGTFASADGGKTWTDNGLLPGFDGFRLVSDVSFAFSPNGSLAYACVIAVTGIHTGVFVARSRDGGKTWSLPRPVFEDRTGVFFNDKPWIAVDDSQGPFRGRVYVAWNLDEGGRAGKQGGHVVAGIAVAYSTDFAKTFSVPLVVSRFSGKYFAIGATPQVGPDGRVSVVFLRMVGSGRVTQDSLQMVISVDGGRSFAQPRAIVRQVFGLPNHLPHGSFRNLSMPAYAVSPVTGSMMVVWADLRNGDADILKSTSFDGGRRWSVPARVNHDRLHNDKDQFQPALAVAPDGSYWCTWFDRRFDPGNRLIDVEVARSHNDGHTFGTNVRVTGHSWDPAIDAPRPEGKSTNTFIGDYQGVAVDNLTVHPVWNDTQNGRSQEIETTALPVSAVP